MKSIVMILLLTLISPSEKALAQTIGIDRHRANRIIFSISNTVMLVGGTFTSSAKGDRGKRTLGYLLILSGVATVGSRAVTGLLFEGGIDFSVAANFKRDCRIFKNHPDLETQAGLASLANGIEVFKRYDSAHRVAETCALFDRVSQKSIALLSQSHHQQVKFDDEFAAEVVNHQSISSSDLRILKNMFAVNGII